MGNSQLFFGAGKTRAEYAMLELANIPAEDRAPESGLFRLRWFDQSAMMPSEATFFFAHVYREAVRAHYAKTVDYRTANSLAVIPEDIFTSPELLSVWRARQAADSIGCRYDFYIRAFLNRSLERGWHNVPRPNHLYSEEVILDIRDAWVDAKRAYLQEPEHEFFKAHNYVGHPKQVDYIDYLTAFIKTREHPHLVIGSLIKRGLLPMQCAAERFDQALLDRALGV